jgi:hypothetical protein
LPRSQFVSDRYSMELLDVAVLMEEDHTEYLLAGAVLNHGGSRVIVDHNVE